MGEIYEDAEEVLAWPGPSDNSCHTAFDFLSDTILEYNAHEFYLDGRDSCFQLYRHQYRRRIWTL
jgi:hypothetical protein